MSRPFSCIITKNQTIYTHPNLLEHSHTEIMGYFKLNESGNHPSFNGFAKIEISPNNEQSYLITPINEWIIKVDEAYIPSWYENDKDSYETIIRKEAESWLNKVKEKDWDNVDWNDYTPNQCYEYVYSFLQKPFKPLEDRIKNDRNLSFVYAMDVLEGKFELGEPIIATCPWRSCEYAKYAIKERFILGEAIIKGSLHQKEYEYAFKIKL